MTCLSARLRALVEGTGAVRVVVAGAKRPVTITWEGWIMGRDRPGTARSYWGAYARVEGFDREVLLVKKKHDAKVWSLATSYELGRMGLFWPGDQMKDAAVRAADQRLRGAASAATDWGVALGTLDAKVQRP